MSSQPPAITELIPGDIFLNRFVQLLYGRKFVETQSDISAELVASTRKLGEEI